LRGPGLERALPPIVQASNDLASACRTPASYQPLQRRSSRAVAALHALPAPGQAPHVDLDTELIQNELAFCHLTASPELIDISYPGGHILPTAARRCASSTS